MVHRTLLAEHLQATEVPADAAIIENENKHRHGLETAEGHLEDTKMVKNDCVSHSVPSFCSNSSRRPESKSGFTSIDRDLYASKLALETYLCQFKNLSLQDASSMAENAPIYVAKLKVLAENWKKLSPSFSNDSSIESTVESFLKENGLDELEVFFESIGMNPERVSDFSFSLQLKLTGEHGVLPTVTLLEGIGVERRDLGKLIERNRFILCYSACDLQSGLDFLMHVGLQKADLVSVLHRCPEILKPNLKEDWAQLLKILSEFHVGEHAVARLIKHHPKPLAGLPHRNIQTNLDYLYSLGLKKGDIARTLKRTPSILFMDVEKSLKRKVQFLKDQGLSDGEIFRVVSLFPGIFSRSIEDTLHPKLKFLQSLGLEKEQIGKVISSFPALLGHSIEDKMKPLVALLGTVGIKDKLLARLIAVRPSIVAVDVKKTLPDLLEGLVKLGDPRTIYLVLSRGLCEGLSALKERLQYLKSLGFTKEELATMIHNDPRIMQISKLRLQKKVEFLTRTMGYSIKDLVNNSTFLYSHFERRIQRRYGVLNVLQSADIIRGKPSLSQITRRSDKKFRKKYVDPYPQCQALFKCKG
ncbi:hypothetical protein O6H91_23G068700 [Diphasiastrum complanatum]|nr:hypothetical protein O6H91_23G068700 [Diphasiastrum complanatum]